MNNSKIHIDSLFSNGLKNFEIPAIPSDYEMVKEGVDVNKDNVFSNFKLHITENDWLTVKDRLEKESEKVLPFIALSDISNGFKDFEIAITDADWQSTKSKLANTQPKAKKKIIWWWWLNIIVVSAVAAFLIHSLSKNISFKEKTNTSIVNKVNNNEILNSNEISTFVGNNATKNSIILNNEKVGVNKNNVQHLNQTQDSKSKNIISNNKSLNIFVKNLTFNKKENDLINTNAKNTDAKNTDAKLIAEMNESNLKNEQLKENSNIAEIENKIELIKDEKLETIDKQIDANKNAVMDTSKKQKFTNLPAPPPLPKFNFYVGINTQLAQTFRQLDNDNKATYNTIRNNAEKPFTQFSIGLVTGVMKGKNQFQLGAQYTQQNWTSNYLYSYKVYDSLPYKDPNGNIIGYFLTRARDTNINEKQVIKITKIDIPFAYQYQLKLNSKTNLLLGGGGIIGINTKTEGSKMINPANNYLYNYKILKKNENQLSISPQLNIGLQRNLNKNLLLQTNIFGSYSATSRFKKNYGVKEYPYSYGLSLKLLFLIH